MYIHVPQGRSARLTRDTLKNTNITALYTNGISICNIVICQSDDKISLTHVDGNTHPDTVRKEIDWVGTENRKIEVIARERQGQVVAVQVLNFLQEKHHKKKIFPFTQTALGDKKDGVLVNFLERRLCLIEESRDISFLKQNLCRHPKEREFLTVQKARQIMGLREAVDCEQLWTCASPLIFDGLNWCEINATDLTIESSNKKTQEELETFPANNSSFMQLSCAIKRFIECLKKIPNLIGSPNTRDIFIFAEHIEFYFEKNALKLLLRNVSDVAKNGLGEKTKKDKIFAKNITDISDETSFEDFMNLIDGYRNEPGKNSEFKENFLDEVKTCLRHYQHRMLYSGELPQIERINIEGRESSAASSSSVASDVPRFTM